MADAGDGLCCWQLWDVGDRFLRLKESPTWIVQHKIVKNITVAKIARHMQPHGALTNTVHLSSIFQFFQFCKTLTLLHFFNQKQPFFWIITQNAFSLIFLYFWSDLKCISVYCSWILLQKRSKRSILRSWSRFFISWIVIRANHNGINTPKLFNFTFHYYIY